MKKRLTALLLVLCLVFTAMGTAAGEIMEPEDFSNGAYEAESNEGLEVEGDDLTIEDVEDADGIELDVGELLLDEALDTGTGAEGTLALSPEAESNAGAAANEGNEAVTLVFDQYTGDTLTKVYDLNKYGAYKKDGEIVYVIPALKTISSKVTLKPASGSWVEGHTSVKPKLSLSKQFSSADVGDYEFEFKITGLSGTDAAYYTIEPTTISVPAKITPRPVVITPRAGTSKVYGMADPVYKAGTYLIKDESSPLHQDVGGVPSYGIPLNTVDGKTVLTIDDGSNPGTNTKYAYLLSAAKAKGVLFFPGWLSRESGENVGEYRILQGGMDFGKYYGNNFSVTVNDEVFRITQKDITEGDVTVEQPADQTYTGRAIEPEVTVIYESTGLGTVTLKKGTDYTVTYSDNKNVGTATITITGKGNFKGTRTVNFDIVPKGTSISKATGGKKKITVTWKKAGKITGYQVEYGRKKDFSDAKTKSVRDAKKTKVTITGLKSKKSYYVRIRTYLKVNGKKYYSAWSSAKKVKTK